MAELDVTKLQEDFVKLKDEKEKLEIELNNYKKLYEEKDTEVKKLTKVNHELFLRVTEKVPEKEKEKETEQPLVNSETIINKLIKKRGN